jgi:hypothetical protein
VPHREEEIPIWRSKSNKEIQTQLFHKPYSVFAKWKGDSLEDVKKTIACDRKNWKLRQFIKVKADLEQTELVLIENFYTIKEIFHELASDSVYPRVSEQKLIDYLTENRVIDDSYLTTAMVDIHY